MLPRTVSPPRATGTRCSQSVTFSISQPLDLLWTSTGGSDLVRGGFEERDASTGALLRYTSCTFADDGSGTIPAAAFAGFHDNPSGGYSHRLVLSKYREGMVTAPKLGPVRVSLSAQWLLRAWATP